MMKRLKFHDDGYSEWQKAENAAHDRIMAAGYRPNGYDMKTEKVIVLSIQNEHTNSEKRKIYYFNSWQEAEENLVNGINSICLNCAKFKSGCAGTVEKAYTGCVYKVKE